MQRSSSSTWAIPSWLRLVVAGSLLLEIAMTFMVIMAQNGSTPTPVAAMASQLHDLLAIFGSGHVTELKAQVSVLQETQLFVWETVQVGESGCGEELTLTCLSLGHCLNRSTGRKSRD